MSRAMSGKALRALEREYRREREVILADEALSWEKMREISELFKRYAAKRDERR